MRLKMLTRSHYGVALVISNYFCWFFFRYREGERIPRVIVDGFFSVPR